MSEEQRDDKEHSDTPRTDDMLWIDSNDVEVCTAHFARQLERELAIAKKRLWIELEAPATIGTQSAVAPLSDPSPMDRAWWRTQGIEACLDRMVLINARREEIEAKLSALQSAIAVPTKRDVRSAATDEEVGYRMGWNACVDAMLNAADRTTTEGK